MAFSFFGGIHPDENKHLTSEKPIQVFPEPDVLVVPLSQHIGAPCKPLVKKGDAVKVGQKIGDNTGLCVPVHSPVSGIVKAVEMRAHTSGTTMLSVVIENDHECTPCEDIQPRTQDQVDGLTPEELMEIIHQAGIVGMGGATFPTHVKLSSGLGKVDTVIVNAGECEPYITADDRLCREMPEKVISGIKVIMKIFGLQKAHIAIENNKPQAAKLLQACLCTEDGIVIDILPAMYPQGAEKQLIQAITGRQIPPGAPPEEIGCAVFDVQSVCGIYQAVAEGMPAVSQVVTVSGSGVMEPGNVECPIGTPVSSLLDACGGLKEKTFKLIVGGPMTGTAQSAVNVSVDRGTVAVLAFASREGRGIKHTQCIRCGRCARVCPMRLQPLFLYRYASADRLDALEEANVMDCMECGACAYVCPARLPLVQMFREGKARLLEEQADMEDTEEKEA